MISSVGLVACDQTEHKSQQKVTVDGNSATPLWAGQYSGTTPCMGCFGRCDDCPGMSVDLQLNANETFVLNRVSMSGHNDVENIQGKFEFINPDKSLIKLSGLEKRNLIMVDLENKLLEIRIDDSAEAYAEYEDFSLERKI